MNIKDLIVKHSRITYHVAYYNWNKDKFVQYVSYSLTCFNRVQIERQDFKLQCTKVVKTIKTAKLWEY